MNAAQILRVGPGAIMPLQFAQLLDLMGAAAGHRHRIRAARTPAIDRAWTLDVEHSGSRLNPW